MALFRGFAFYNPFGVIVFSFDWKMHAPNPSAFGTHVWDWFEDAETVKTHFGRAMMGEPLPPVLLRMSVSKRNAALSAVAKFLPTHLPNAPVCGVFSAFSDDVLAMTKREREVAKLLPTTPTKQIARQLGVTESTINTLRARIGERLGRTGSALISTLAELHDIL